PTCTWAGPAFGRSSSGSAARPQQSVVSCAVAARPDCETAGEVRALRGTEAGRAARRRPKASKFDHLELADVVQSKLRVKWSPEQISLHLAETFPDRAEMRVCPETIYQALYVQGRGHLHVDLHRHLRPGLRAACRQP